uniref:ATP synthase complex subunit 8 n=1 Tax=Apochrysa matsumurae TaxID=417555 RepID=E6N2M8_APOMA|nr:ATP synthase F0 subunit 8 [Apochrysa matsumurae]BAJ61137.1 ATP synthase F0 subunit 8 [Apochrysa matsumurae]
MPQMSPLNWWFLFIYFILLLLIFSILNYYIIMYKFPSSQKKSFSKKSLNWKW